MLPLSSWSLPLQQDIKLSVPYDLTGQERAKVVTVYKSMDGWLDDKDGPA